MMSTLESAAARVVPAERTRDPAAGLSSLVRLGRKRFTLSFAVYEDSRQRPGLMARLSREIPEANLVQVSLQDPDLDLWKLSVRLFDNLREIAEHNAGRRTIDGVLLVDWEKRLLPGKAPAEQPTTSLLGVFNMGREALRERFGCPLVVFVPQDAYTIILSGAADLASWRSGTYFFPVDGQADAAELAAALEAARSERRPQPRFLIGWLEEALAALESSEPLSGHADSILELRAEALACLAELCLRRDETARAGEVYQQLEQLGRSHRHRPWVAQAREARRKLPPSPPRDREPDPWKVFRGAAALGAADQLYGREEDLHLLLKMLAAPNFRLGTLWGEVGCGKTSLVHAGLIPALKRMGHVPIYLRAYHEAEAELTRAIAQAAGLVDPPGDPVGLLQAARAVGDHLFYVLCDQFEQLFTATDGERRQAFLDTLAEAVNAIDLPLRWLLIVRADHFHALSRLDPLIHLPSNHPLDPANRHRLRWLREADAFRVLAHLNRAAQADWPDSLMQDVVRELVVSEGRVKPVEIQLAAAALYLQGVRTWAAYRRLGGVAGLLKDERYLFSLISQSDFHSPIIVGT